VSEDLTDTEIRSQQSPVIVMHITSKHSNLSWNSSCLPSDSTPDFDEKADSMNEDQQTVIVIGREDSSV
jgi:hypothetical protein